MGLEKLRDAVGCDDVSCATEIGGAAGSDLLLTGTIGKLGSRLTVGLTLIDVVGATVHARAHQSIVDDEDEYENAIAAALDELLGTTQVAVIGGLGIRGGLVGGVIADPPGSGDEAPKRTESGRTVAGVTHAPAAAFPWQRVTGMTLTGVGVGLVGLGVIATFVAKGAAGDYESTWDADDAHSSETWARVMGVSYVMGVGALATGLFLWLTDDAPFGSASPVSVRMEPTAGGVALGLSGAW